MSERLWYIPAYDGGGAVTRLSVLTPVYRGVALMLIRSVSGVIMWAVEASVGMVVASISWVGVPVEVTISSVGSRSSVSVAVEVTLSTVVTD